MKHLFLLAAALFAFQPLAFADWHDDHDDDQQCETRSGNGACETAYKNDLAICLQAARGLKPHTVVKTLKACVREAKSDKKICVHGGGSGGSACVALCDTTYNSDVANCDAQFDPSTCAPTDSFCIAVTNQEQAACLGTATTNLNACTGACAVTIP